MMIGKGARMHLTRLVFAALSSATLSCNVIMTQAVVTASLLLWPLLTRVTQVGTWAFEKFLAKNMRAQILNGIVHSPYPDLEDKIEPSIFAYLQCRLKKYGDKTALIHGEDSISYSKLLERLAATAAGFQSHGIGKGDRVLVHMNNTIESFVAAFSIPLTGAALVTSDLTLSEGELLDHARKTGATHVVTDDAHVDVFKRLVKPLKFKAMFSTTEAYGFTNIGKFCCQARDYKEVLDCEESVVFVAHSTGTTGVTKIVDITQQSYLAKLRCLEIVQFATPEDVCLGGGNISFKVCFTYSFFVMSIGATTVILDKYSPEPDVFTAFRDHKVTVVFGTPMKILEVAFEVKRTGQSFPHVKKFIGIGTPMTERVKSEILSAFSPFEIRSCYGMAEANGCLALPPNGEIKGGDVGFPAPSTRMKVVDTTNGAVLGPNQTGEVFFYAPQYAGYYKTPRGTTSVISSDGWIHTGDLGYYSQEGRLHVMGRLNSPILAPELKTGLPAVEECLHFHPSVAEAAVVPITDSDGKGLLAAIVVTRPDEKPNKDLAKQIESFVNEYLPTAPRIKGGIFFADAIPRSGFGKIKRPLLPVLLASLRRMDATDFKDPQSDKRAG